MGLPYIKVEPEEAVQVIDQCIVAGYQLKDKISTDYHSDKEKWFAKIDSWRAEATNWVNETIGRLGEVFVSEKELYNFRDAEPPFGATSENVHYVGIVSKLKARIDKLNDYDENIRRNFNVHLEVVMRDKITQVGDNGTIKTKN